MADPIAPSPLPAAADFNPVRFDCSECGPRTKADEDGCCSYCGRSVLFVDARGLARADMALDLLRAAEEDADSANEKRRSAEDEAASLRTRAEEAERERDEARHLLSARQAVHDRDIDEMIGILGKPVINRAREIVARLAEVEAYLREQEWSAWRSSDGGKEDFVGAECCPECAGMRANGHETVCRLDAMLRVLSSSRGSGHERNAMTTDTIGDALPREMTRVRDEVLPAYVEIGPAGTFAATMMRRDLDAAQKAMAEGDVVAMLAVYKSLKEWSL